MFLCSRNPPQISHVKNRGPRYVRADPQRALPSEPSCPSWWAPGWGQRPRQLRGQLPGKLPAPLASCPGQPPPAGCPESTYGRYLRQKVGNWVRVNLYISEIQVHSTQPLLPHSQGLSVSVEARAGKICFVLSQGPLQQIRFCDF